MAETYKLKQSGKDIQRAIDQVVNNEEAVGQIVSSDGKGGLKFGYNIDIKPDGGLRKEQVEKESGRTQTLISVDNTKIVSNTTFNSELNKKQDIKNIKQTAKGDSDVNNTKYPSVAYLKEELDKRVTIPTRAYRNHNEIVADFDTFKNDCLYSCGIGEPTALRPCIFKKRDNILMILDQFIIYSYNAASGSAVASMNLETINSKANQVDGIIENVENLQENVNQNNSKISNLTQNKISQNDWKLIDNKMKENASQVEHNHKAYDKLLLTDEQVTEIEKSHVITDLILSSDRDKNYNWKPIENYKIKYSQLEGNIADNEKLNQKFSALESKTLDDIEDGSDRILLKTIKLKDGEDDISPKIITINSDTLTLDDLQKRITAESKINLNEIVCDTIKLKHITPSLDLRFNNKSISEINQVSCDKVLANTIGSKTQSAIEAKNVEVSQNVKAKKFDGSFAYLTEAPTSANTSGGLKVVVLTEDPAEKFDGYLYLICKENN